MEYLYRRALNDYQGMMASLPENTSSAKVIKKSKIRALIDSAGDADSITSTLGFLAEMFAFEPKRYEELCDDLHATAFPPARLPWIPVVKSKRSFVNTLYYQLWNSSAEGKCRSLQLQRMLARCFPNYLPKRYHSMDCLSLLKHSSGDKCLHFANASQLFVFNQLYGLHYWYLVTNVHGGANMEFKATVFMLTSTYHSSHTQNRLFSDHGDLHECNTAEEFLLEPWLLMQIPWHPALYNQWLAAALAEVIKAKIEIVEFYRWPVPKKMSTAVELLLSLLETLHRRLLMGAGLINWLTNPGNGFEPHLMTATCVLNQVVLPSLPTIELLVSNKFSQAAKALKRMAWHSDGKATKGEDVVATCNSENINSFQTMYGLRYFEMDKAADIFGFKEGSFEAMLKHFDSLPTEIDFIPMQSCYTEIRKSQGAMNQDLWEKKTEEIKLLTQKIVSERVKGQVTFSDSLWQRNGSCFANFYRKMVYNADFEKGVQPNDVSVIYNLHSLQAKLEVAVEEATCSGLVYLKLKNEGRQVYLQASNSSSPDMSLKTVEQLLTKVVMKKWTLETLKEKIPAECKLTINSEESCPGAEVGYQDIIKSFEVRIKKLVFHIFDTNSTKGFEEHFVLAEWQFIQYILPCFVTHIGQLASVSKTKPCELQAYTRFVHNLIQSFELNLKKTQFTPGSYEIFKRCIDMELPEWACKNQVNNVIGQLLAVENELGMMVHGTHKKMKNAGSADFPLGQICFRLFSDSLKNSSLNRARPIIFKCWTESILQYIPRMKEAIHKVVLISTNPFPTNNLLQAVAVLEELKYVAVTYNVNPVDELSLVCLEKADLKLKMLMGKQPVAMRGKLDKKLYLEMQMLTVQQLLGVALFGIVKSWKNHDKSLLEVFDPSKTFRSAIINSAVEKFVASDWRGLRSLLTPLLCDKDRNDLSLVSLQFVMTSARATYMHVLKAIEMKAPAKKKNLHSLYPVIPIKFCRGCVKFDVKLMKCKICVDNHDFPDVHYFCSDKCEETVLAEGHLEEHDHDLMVKCGLV